MLSYNSVKCVICHNSGLEGISKFFRLVNNGVYVDCSALVASLVGKTRLLQKDVEGICISFTCQIFQSTSVI